jgi:hypothetical protein
MIGKKLRNNKIKTLVNVILKKEGLSKYIKAFIEYI